MKTSDINALLKVAEKAVAMARKIVAMADDLGMEPTKRRKRKARVEHETPKPKARKPKPKAGPAVTAAEIDD